MLRCLASLYYFIRTGNHSGRSSRTRQRTPFIGSSTSLYFQWRFIFAFCWQIALRFSVSIHPFWINHNQVHNQPHGTKRESPRLYTRLRVVDIPAHETFEALNVCFPAENWKLVLLKKITLYREKVVPERYPINPDNLAGYGIESDDDRELIKKSLIPCAPTGMADFWSTPLDKRVWHSCRGGAWPVRNRQGKFKVSLDQVSQYKDVVCSQEACITQIFNAMQRCIARIYHSWRKGIG